MSQTPTRELLADLIIVAHILKHPVGPWHITCSKANVSALLSSFAEDLRDCI